MCGVFGFVAKGNKGPDLATIKRIAAITMSRGRHAWGMAWIDSKGRMKAFKQAGRLVDTIGLVAMAHDAIALIGHCRFATQGDPADNLNNHPHPADGGWIVHNGVIHHYRQIVEGYNLYPNSDCDSEVLGLLIERTDGELIDRCAKAASIAGGSPLVMLGLWKPDRLIAVRQGNPLHVGETSRGFYLGSLAEGLPGKVAAMADNQVFEFGEA